MGKSYSYGTEEEQLLVTLEEVQSIAEEYMSKEVQMLYQMTFLDNEDLEKMKKWLMSHPQYLKLQALSVLTGEKTPRT